MKILKLLLVPMVLFLAIFACTRETDAPAIVENEIPVFAIRYTGPTNTEELRTKLFTSKDPILSSLNKATKESLIANMMFSDGLYRGMNQKDANIEELYNTTFTNVLASILDADVVKNNNPTNRGAYKVINGGSTGTYKVKISECDNCFAGGVGGCCNVGGNGCCDYMIINNSGN
jgi:hypothetical protein